MMGHSGNNSSAALVKDSEFPFTQHIQACPVLERFKLPALEWYDGSTDPVDHWQQYGNMIGLQNVPDGIICRTFVTTLPVQFRTLKSSVPVSYPIFLGPRSSQNLLPTSLPSSKSPLRAWKDYVCHFNQESLIINNLNEGNVIAAFMEEVSSPYCLMTLARMAPKTMSELLEEVNK